MTDIFELLKGKDSEKQPVIVQGITGKFGTRHTKLMMEYGKEDFQKEQVVKDKTLILMKM